MKWKPLLSSLLIGCALQLSAQEITQLTELLPKGTTSKECFKSVFVESPIADTYIAYQQDSTNFGKETVMKVRGLPEKKIMMAMVSYEISHLDPNYMQTASLKIYTASKNRGNKIALSGLPRRIDEIHTSWSNHPACTDLIANQPVTERPYITFDVTNYVRSHLKDGFINFNLQSDSKKPIDIASRESGLSTELIIEMCLLPQSISEEARSNSLNADGSGLKVLPSALEGKLTIQLMGLPDGGFGDLMLMTDQGSILQQVPLAIQNADVTYHTIDYGPLSPGIYWAILRMGRVMVKDRFRLRPENGTTFLQVDTGIIAENDP